jgi:hypothetical protein
MLCGQVASIASGKPVNRYLRITPGGQRPPQSAASLIPAAPVREALTL